MLSHTSSISEAGGIINEDAVGSGPSYIFVIDGASGLNGRNIMNEESDAKWLSRSTANMLRERLPDLKISISSIITSIMKDLAHLWKGNSTDYPSASIAIWRENDGQLEYFGLADCDASVMLRSGKVISWAEENVAKLDNLALKQMVAYSEEHQCSMEEARKACAEILIHNRQLKNTENGYWVLDPSCTGIPHARTYLIPAEKCDSVFLCSDGFSQLIGFGELPSIQSLHRAVKKSGLLPMKKTLFALQENDHEMTKLPRFKFRDDTSAVFSFVEG